MNDDKKDKKLKIDYSQDEEGIEILENEYINGCPLKEAMKKLEKKEN